MLTAMSPQAFTLAGFERVEGVDYAQLYRLGLSGRGFAAQAALRRA